VASSLLTALGDVARHLPLVRRDPLAALDALASASGHERHSDLQYGPREGQRLDLYVPTAPVPTPGRGRSAVLFIHGGRWTSGRKEEYRFVARSLAAAGHVVAVCDYRKYPDVRFPAFVEDGAAALAWAFSSLARHGVDPKRIFLMGHSAGAHIAALATMDARYGRQGGYDPAAVAGLILMSGPFDFFPIKSPDLQDIFGPVEQHPSTQPLRFARSGLPPFLLLHGRRDRTVHPANSARLASAIRGHGGRATAIFYDFVNHTNILAGLSDRVGLLFAPVLDDVTRFIGRRATEIEGVGAVEDQGGNEVPVTGPSMPTDG
jgi:acetyl esterase/lipase